MGAPLEFVFRFDAGHLAGAGHFMRQLAVAQRAKTAGRATMLLQDSAMALMEEVDDDIELVGLPELDPMTELDWLRHRFGPDRIFFIDSYKLPPSYYRRLSRSSYVVAFEDGERPLDSHLIVKPRPRGGEASQANVIEGCKYIPVRRSFTSQVTIDRCLTDKARLLVSFGASDPTGKTAEVLRQLPDEAARDWELVIVEGPLAAEQSLPTQQLRERGWSFEVASAPHMAQVMASVDAAVVASGSIVWELAALAIPTLAVAVASNQARNAAILAERGCIAQMPELARFLASAKLRAGLAHELGALVDGHGASRVMTQTIERYQ